MADNSPITGNETHEPLRNRERAGLAGLSFARVLTNEGENVLDEVLWTERSAVIRSETGRVIFRQEAVEAPAFWSDLAVNVVASRYFRGGAADDERETSVKQVLVRVVDTICQWGIEQQYFATDTDALVYRDELLHLLVHQMASFNSPVWFNVGVEAQPQCSACFILSVEDTMESILEWYRQEGMIFKGGSGAGVNLSTLRSCREKLGSGGTASGPVSFMKAADASAGVIKSGGKTRRAAKMAILDVDHPDILPFIRCKAHEEVKARALIDAGFEGTDGEEAYATVAFQNSNHAVRVTDAFMEADRNDDAWTTRYILDRQVADMCSAREIMAEIGRAVHACGDPGLQFHSTIERWHTCPHTGPITASNPCSEYMHVSNSACNLASLRLTAFLDEDGFRADLLEHAAEIMITAQEIIVDRAAYPSRAITENSRQLRALGLGYADLGSLLMQLGFPYDSPAGRNMAGLVTALMTGAAYLQSARMAKVKGPFAEFDRNREPMLRVMDMHRKCLDSVTPPQEMEGLLEEARSLWDEVLSLGRVSGFRNCQVTVLAPTGTVGFMMDCATTGVEPEMALVKFKNLSGGGQIKIVNNAVSKALQRLGYDSEQIGAIVSSVESGGTMEGIDELLPEHLPVFDCAFKPLNGNRFIAPEGHVRMMGAVQPFLSGAISKTLNLPNSAKPEDIEEVFRFAWQAGLKALAVYRDGCKVGQPLSVSPRQSSAPNGPVRRRLPIDCASVRHKFEIAGQKGYIHTGFYEDGKVGEIFIRMAKEGSTVSGLMDTIATLTSIALQYGVPLEALVNKFSHVRFEPSGFTSNKDIPIAKSLTDYIFRFLGSRFLSNEQQESSALLPTASTPRGSDDAHLSGDGRSSRRSETTGTHEQQSFALQADAPSCYDCGSIMVRSGSCYKCLNCGAANGCS